MTNRRLIIGGTWPRRRPLTRAEFVWRAASDETSFHTKLEPQLAAIGAVPEPNLDLVALAVLSFLADRTVRRPSKGWEREIELDLPVHDIDRWEVVAWDVAHTLEILTGDSWTLNLRKWASSKLRKVAERPEVDQVLLFSSGGDSLCDAVRSLTAGERLLLVSH